MKIDRYLASRSESDRLNELNNIAGCGFGIPLDITKSLIKLPISDTEKLKLIEYTLPTNGIEWELFLLNGILNCLRISRQD